MRVLLINANRFRQPWPVIPFGLCCVAGSVEKAGHEVHVLDLCFSKRPGAEIRHAVEHRNPDVVGLSIRNIDNGAGYNTLFLLDETKEKIIAPLKQVFKGPIVIGGPSVGISGAEMLEFFDLHHAIRGDGESAFVELLKRFEKQLPLKGVGGLILREDGRLVEDNLPLAVQDLDSLPRPKPQRYIDLRAYRRYDSPIPIQTKRGCALKCSYCTYNKIEGSQYRLRDPRRVADEIEELVKETGIDHIEFTDSTFNIPLGHAKAVLRAVLAKGMNLRLRTMGLNPGAVDEELADLMRQAEFRDVDLGAEAGCDAMLQSLGKSFGKEAILRAGALLRARKIPTTWYLLVGAPGETAETLKETFDTIDRAASPWDLVNIGVGVRLYSGSPMAEKMRQEIPGCTRDNFLHPVSGRTYGLTLESVKVLTKSAALRHRNYFMYDEDEKTPAFLLMLGASILKAVAPRQPIWRLFIMIRTLQRVTGFNLVRKILHDRKVRRVLGNEPSKRSACLVRTGS